MWLAPAIVAARVRDCTLCSLAMVAPAQAVPFADDEELGEAWHAVVGFTRAVPTEQQMHSLLVDNLMFALRCAASPDSFFFGPTRDLLSTSA